MLPVALGSGSVIARFMPICVQPEFRFRKKGRDEGRVAGIGMDASTQIRPLNGREKSQEAQKKRKWNSVAAFNVISLICETCLSARFGEVKITKLMPLYFLLIVTELRLT